MPDLTTILAAVGTAFGGINLAFIIKLIYNDLHDLRTKLDRHIEWHLNGTKEG